MEDGIVVSLREEDDRRWQRYFAALRLAFPAVRREVIAALERPFRGASEDASRPSWRKRGRF